MSRGTRISGGLGIVVGSMAFQKILLSITILNVNGEQPVYTYQYLRTVEFRGGWASPL